jgi:hypothetical protein
MPEGCVSCGNSFFNFSDLVGLSNTYNIGSGTFVESVDVNMSNVTKILNGNSVATIALSMLGGVSSYCFDFGGGYLVINNLILCFGGGSVIQYFLHTFSPTNVNSGFFFLS